MAQAVYDQEDDPDLPEGWTSYLSTDDRPGERCYVNLNTGTTQWTLPETLPAGWASAVSSTTDRVYYYNTFTGYSQYVKPEAPCVPSEDPERRIAKHWEVRHSNTHDGAIYYFNKETGAAQFHAPDLLVHAPDEHDPDDPYADDAVRPLVTPVLVTREAPC